MKKFVLFINLLIFFFGAYAQSWESIPQFISACKNNDIVKVKALLLAKTKGIDTIYDGYTPLMYAVQNENLNLVKLLIENGANENLASNSLSPMWLADKGNYTKKQSENSKLILNYLIKSALNKVPNAPNPIEIRKAIDTAVRRSMRHPYSAIQFYQIFPDRTYNGSIRVICDAAVYDNTAMIERVKFTNKTMDEPLPNLSTHVRLENAYNFAFQLIINSERKWKAEPVDQVSTSTRGELNNIIKNKTNPNTLLLNGIYPLIAATMLDDIEIVKNLIDLGADIHVNNLGVTALLKACANGDIPMAELLISKGADIEQKNADGANCLFMAASYGHADVIEYLIRKGSSPNAQRETGYSALMAASGRGHYDVVNVLLNNNADPNYSAPDGATALHSASGFGWDKIAKLLLSKKANVNAVDEDGYTPLHFACLDGYINTVKVLLQAGANKNLKTNKGKTPSDIAQKYGYLKIVELLKNQ